MSAISQFGQTPCRRPTLAELQSIVGFSTIGATMYTETDNQTGAFIDTTKLATNGSRLICKSGGGVGMIVAPSTSQVSRSWYCRDDAKLIAQQVTQTCCTQWFIPTCAQLQTGYSCRDFWDSFSFTPYWSSTEVNASNACSVHFNTGSTNLSNKASVFCVRAFRCVTY